jgi:DNA-binding CsgD family transcriptional regulator
MSEGTRGRSHILAGLVSPKAAELYSRLLTNASLPLGTGPGQVDLDDEATRELLTAAVAFRSGQDDGIIRPVAPARALRALLELRHQDLGDLQQRVRDGWRRLENQLPLTLTGGSTTTNRHGVEIITDGPRISAIATELYHSAKVQFRGTETGYFPTRPSANRGFIPPPSAIEAGVRYRYLYRASVNNTDWGQQIIRRAMAAGEEIRLRREIPVKLMQVDSVAALVSVDRPANAAMLVRAGVVLDMIAEWFDLMWDDRLTTNIDGSAHTGLKPDQLNVLRLLPSADSDDAIAKSLGTSVTTVRRHVKAIYAALGVNTRFAAGAAATRRGWI